MNGLIRQFFELLSEWNRKINLTAINSEEDFLCKHVEDSVAVIPHLGDVKTLLDLGTGAGIPGIILKIHRSEIEVTLLDSTRKKISFCEEAVRRLHLRGIRAVWGRAEDAKMIGELGRFDVVVSRATWKLGELLKMARPYAASYGRLIAMKGPGWREELAATAGAKKKVRRSSSPHRAPFVLEGAHPYRLSNGDSRFIVVFK